MSGYPIAELDAYVRVAVYPAASGAEYFLSFLAATHPEILARIVALGDRDENKIGRTQHGIRIHSPEELAGLDLDLVLVASIQRKTLMVELDDLFEGRLPIRSAEDIREYADHESSRSALRRKADSLGVASDTIDGLLDRLPRWYQSLPLGNGRYTPSNKGLLTFRLLDQIQLPASLDGLRVLDLGASDGFYSFECEARGASEVTAVEDLGWSAPKGFERFRSARELYGSSVQHRVDAVESLSADRDGTFDLILCLGLYYHLRDPFSVLRSLYEMTGQSLILSGRTVNMPLDWPASDVVFEDQPEPSYMVLADAKVGKWTANVACLENMLRLAGFSRVEVTHHLVPPGSHIGTIAITATR